MHRTTPIRRTSIALAVLGAGALALAGCLPTPPTLPTAAPPQPTQTQTAPESDPAEPSESQEATPPQAGDYAHTVDDGAGDVWSFTVTSIDDDPPMESGEPEPGTSFVAIRIDGHHDEGGASFTTCFDMLVVGSDGETYDWADTVAVTAEDDIFYVDDTFEGARAVVQLPEGVDPVQVILRSTFGHPAVPDTVLDVEQ
ncbi:hypothetical protein LG314_10890 [Agrococcus terreus]|uniref:hypothetical protein n=1 Tax=Agrococcus terreus TaxID=574649 RepID=UPI0038510964